MTGSSEKANHYLSLLDNARVNASWSELPELTRKVNKHASQRKILIQTATAEYEVVAGSSDTSRQTHSDAGAQSASLTTLSSTLRSEADRADEDAFQGKSCLLWARWIGLEKNTATTGFDTVSAMKDLAGKNLTTWTKICIVKSAYIEGTSYVHNGRPTEGRKVFSAALSNMQPHRDLVLSTPQLAYWAEQLLAQLAVGSGKTLGSAGLDATQVEALRYWATIASKTREVPASTFKNSTAHMTRVLVWRKYYEYLSSNLNHTASDPANTNATGRLQQSTELQQVERSYENELLRNTKFPTANETNSIVEEWVEQAIHNWQILCGPRWRESELGEGGRNAVGRNTLDILYRAATKTFQSTLILRRLFQVHLSLSEFDLAYRAFDTYLELVQRGRIRVAKSRVPEPGQESDEAVLTTISAAITGLCKYGRQKEARKAYELCLKLEDWLTTSGFGDEQAAQEENAPNGRLTEQTTNGSLGPAALQTVFRAIGSAKAHWSRWTPASERRSELQEEALTNLRTASDHGEPEIETLYATSLLLAETRDISGAIQAAKQALSKVATANESAVWTVERKLVSQWHLLALLLSSRQEFDSATKSCTAAFEQFASSDLHLGPERNTSVSSNIEKQFTAAVSGLAGEMESDELQRIIEVRITELALTELMDGPEEAVNSSNELLSLFSRLFGHLKIPLETPTGSRSLLPPKSSAGTVKSARASIFGRRKHESRVESIREKSDDVASIATNTTRPSTRATQAPTIQVTTEDEKPVNKKHHFRRSYESAHSKVSANPDSRTPSLVHDQKKQDDRHGLSQDRKPPQEQSQATTSSPLPILTDGPGSPTPVIPLNHDNSAHSKQELPEVGHNLSSQERIPPPASHDHQPPQQDVRLPTVHPFTNATSPSPRMPKALAQRQALSLLTKVWLVIAALYRRANMFDDSKEASDEAAKAATRVEALVGAIDHSARSFAEAGWGAGNRSLDEVWADVYCERAELQLAIWRHQIKEDKTTSNEDLRNAVDHYEQCLMFLPNHPAGIVGLSNILLDSYERKVDLSRRATDRRLQLAEQEHASISTVTSDHASQPANGTVTGRASNTGQPDHPTHPSKTDEDLKKSPENLNRIAARDRAYGLLSTLTKLGTGWDYSEAWYALARAHELGGEIEKAKSILWWCVELEDTRPIRHWRNLGYSL